MFGVFSFLGFVYNSRKYFLALGVLVLLWGFKVQLESYYYEWHVEPVELRDKEILELNSELNISSIKIYSLQSLLKKSESDCENRINELLTQNELSEFNQTIREIEEKNNAIFIDINGTHGIFF